MFVISRNTAFTYREKPVTARQAFGSGNTLASFYGTLTAFGSTDSSTDVFTPTLNFVLPHFFASEPVSVPEPSSLAILALALTGLGVWRLLSRRNEFGLYRGVANENRGSAARHSASGRPSSFLTIFVPSTIATIL